MTIANCEWVKWEGVQNLKLNRWSLLTIYHKPNNFSPANWMHCFEWRNWLSNRLLSMETIHEGIQNDFLWIRCKSIESFSVLIWKVTIFKPPSTVQAWIHVKVYQSADFFEEHNEYLFVESNYIDGWNSQWSLNHSNEELHPLAFDLIIKKCIHSMNMAIASAFRISRN